MDQEKRLSDSPDAGSNANHDTSRDLRPSYPAYQKPGIIEQESSSISELPPSMAFNGDISSYLNCANSTHVSNLYGVVFALCAHVYHTHSPRKSVVVRWYYHS